MMKVHSRAVKATTSLIIVFHSGQIEKKICLVGCFLVSKGTNTGELQIDKGTCNLVVGKKQKQDTFSMF